LAGGVASGLFGVVGGIIMVPAMVFFMKMDMKYSVGKFEAGVWWIANFCGGAVFVWE
jgi:uncharacterized membrane protein YfcA